MHEFALITRLLDKVQDIAKEQHAKKVVEITLRWDDSAHVSPEQFKKQFLLYAQGSVADGARVEIKMDAGKEKPREGDVVLESMEVIYEGMGSER